MKHVFARDDCIGEIPQGQLWAHANRDVRALVAGVRRLQPCILVEYSVMAFVSISRGVRIGPSIDVARGLLVGCNADAICGVTHSGEIAVDGVLRNVLRPETSACQSSGPIRLRNLDFDTQIRLTWNPLLHGIGHEFEKNVAGQSRRLWGKFLEHKLATCGGIASSIIAFAKVTHIVVRLVLCSGNRKKVSESKWS